MKNIFRDLAKQYSPFVVIVTLLVALYGVLPGRAQFASQANIATSVAGTNTVTMVVFNMGVVPQGVPIVMTPANTNTGPTTFNINSIGAVSVRRPSSLGQVTLSGSELQAGVQTTFMYDGSNFNIQYPVDLTPIGSAIEGRFVTAPPGYLIEDGSCVSRSTYAALFTLLGSTYGACDGSTTFGVPDSRGALAAALDNQGANGAANRITSAGSGCTATALAAAPCGSQNQTLTLPQLPTGISVSGTVTHSGGQVPAASNNQSSASSVTLAGGGSANVPIINGGGGWSYVPSLFGTMTSTNTSGSAHPVLNPVTLVRRVIKY